MKPKPNHIIKDSEIVEGKSKIDMVISQSTQTFSPSISSLKFPFDLKDDQIAAVDAWMENNYRGTILYSTGTGKTEIAFECARRLVGQLLSLKRMGSPSKMDEIFSKDSILNAKKIPFLFQNRLKLLQSPITKKISCLYHFSIFCFWYHEYP